MSSATALALPTLLRGFIRRGKGPRHERGFWLQRAPQLAAGINLFLVSCAFEAIELVLGPKATFSAARPCGAER